MLYQLLQKQLRDAVRALLPEADLAAVEVRPCPEPRFGDYQTNALIPLARARGLNPRQFAQQVVDRLDVTEWCEKPEVAGAGFLNFRLRRSAMERHLLEACRGEHLFFQKAEAAWTVILDFSSPNVAKPMHVGHIRSTILGDSLARIFRFLGHQVISDNHIGDWGTQFGLLLQYVRENQPLTAENPAAFRIDDLEQFYKAAKKRFDNDAVFAEASRRAVVELQSGHPGMLKLWEVFCRESLRHCEEIYQRLGVKFDVTLGESFYNDRLPGVVQELQTRGLCRESEGALAVFFENSAELKDHPAILKKSDGGYNYFTTDLATVQFRQEKWSPDLVLYVTDGRQQLHFKQLFATFQRWQPASTARLVHVWFGMVLGEDGRPFKTRTGENIKLAELLDEAEARAFAVVTEKNPGLGEIQRREIARKVGLGAIKYADLLPNRQSDYVFSWDKMLALHGNTAPYLQYAFTRVQSIFRKAGGAEDQLHPAGLSLAHPAELALARHLLNFGFTLSAVAAEYRPNFLCNYLYELAGWFAAFYEACPVLKAAEPERQSRLALCFLTAKVLKEGLRLLGIETSDQM